MSVLKSDFVVTQRLGVNGYFVTDVILRGGIYINTVHFVTCDHNNLISCSMHLLSHYFMLVCCCILCHPYGIVDFE